jgi:LPS-assembly lipoprotein
MWWPDGIGPARGSWCGLLLAGSLVLTTAACGFRPLHGPPPAASVSPDQKLALTEIRRLSGREGQRLHNLLRDRLNPAGQPARPAYLLSVTLTSRTAGLGIRKDETATRANLVLNAKYTLQDKESRSVLADGISKSVNSYNILNELFATTISEDDALKRGLRQIADDIALRLAVHFAAPVEEAPAGQAP